MRLSAASRVVEFAPGIPLADCSCIVFDVYEVCAFHENTQILGNFRLEPFGIPKQNLVDCRILVFSRKSHVSQQNNLHRGSSQLVFAHSMDHYQPQLTMTGNK